MDELACEGRAVDPPDGRAVDRDQKYTPTDRTVKREPVARIRTGLCCRKAAGGFGRAQREEVASTSWMKSIHLVLGAFKRHAPVAIFRLEAPGWHVRS